MLNLSHIYNVILRKFNDISSIQKAKNRNEKIKKIMEMFVEPEKYLLSLMIYKKTAEISCS